MHQTRALLALLVVTAACAITCAITCAIGCPQTASTACNSDDDCTRATRCILGTCTAAEGEGEGSSSSEGEGAPGEGEGESTTGEGEGEGVSAGEGEGVSAGEGEGEGAGTCGNGHLDPGEQCDDGNQVDFDGCNHDCTTSCYAGAGVAAEFVDDGGACDALMSAELAWVDALKDCRARGGNLATVESSAENDAILASATSNNNWIGLNDLAVEGTMAWVDGSPSAFTTFAPGEPNNSGGIEDCVETRLGDHAWNDDDCSIPNAYVCEFTAPNHCGDFVVDAGEECDDGNTVAGDGCSATCTQEPGFSCLGPFCGVQRFNVPADGTLDDALSSSSPGTLVAIDAGAYTITNDIFADVTLVATGAGVTVNATNFRPALHAKNNVTLKVAGIDVHSDGSDAIVIENAAQLVLVGGTVSAHGFGLRASSNAGVIVRRTTFTNCTSGGMRFDTPSYDVADVIVHDNPGNGVEFHANPSTLLAAPRFAHVTIADNAGIGVLCASTPIDASIVWNNGQGETSGTCNFVESDVDAPTPPPGSLNLNVDPQFVNDVGQDFHLTATSPAIDQAPLSNEPRDVDGDVRNGVRDIGADEF